MDHVWSPTRAISIGALRHGGRKLSPNSSAAAGQGASGSPPSGRVARPDATRQPLCNKCDNEHQRASKLELANGVLAIKASRIETERRGPSAVLWAGSSTRIRSRMSMGARSAPLSHHGVFTVSTLPKTAHVGSQVKRIAIDGVTRPPRKELRACANPAAPANMGAY